MWWRTQKRIERTSKGIAGRVAAAVVDIKGKLEKALKSVEESVKAEVAAIETKITAQVAVIKETVDALPDIDPDELAIDYEALSAEIGPMLAEAVGPKITDCVTMAVHQFKAQETKELQALLGQADLDGAIESMGAEAQAAAISQMNLGQKAAVKIMSATPSKKWLKDHPYGELGLDIFKSSQIEVLAALQGQGKAQAGQGVMESARFAPGEV